MSSDNPPGGDDQQETGSRQCLSGLVPEWVCGFVDGEGCFSVATHRNPHVRRTRGWQVSPTFQVSQHRDNRAVLEALATFFGVGKVREKGPRSTVLVYSVYGTTSCAEAIVPFFERYQLRVKHEDFKRYADIVRRLQAREHLTPDGFERIVGVAYSMNAHGRQRSRSLEDVLQGSSETVREAPATYTGSSVMIQSELHGDMQSQTEMIWPPS